MIQKSVEPKKPIESSVEEEVEYYDEEEENNQ
jgi:hypothetical protein